MLKKVYNYKVADRPKTLLTYQNIDVVTISYKAVRRAKYFILITNAATLTYKVSFYLTKDGTFYYIKNLITSVKTLSVDVQIVYLNSSRKFRGQKIVDLTDKKGIELRIITPYNSKSNRRAKVSNYIVCVIARKIML